MALLREKLQRLDAGFGVDALALAALHVEACPPQQAALGPRLGEAARADAALLIDRLGNRLGAARVSRA